MRRYPTSRLIRAIAAVAALACAAWPSYAQPYPVYPAYAPGGVIVEQPYAYYCGSLQAYYPDVQACPEPWIMLGP